MMTVGLTSAKIHHNRPRALKAGRPRPSGARSVPRLAWGGARLGIRRPLVPSSSWRAIWRPRPTSGESERRSLAGPASSPQRLSGPGAPLPRRRSLSRLRASFRGWRSARGCGRPRLRRPHVPLASTLPPSARPEPDHVLRALAAVEQFEAGGTITPGGRQAAVAVAGPHGQRVGAAIADQYEVSAPGGRQRE